MTTRYLTSAEAADILRLSVWQTVNLCRDNKLRATKPSGQWLIAADDLQAFIDAGYNQQAAS